MTQHYPRQYLRHKCRAHRDCGGCQTGKWCVITQDVLYDERPDGHRCPECCCPDYLTADQDTKRATLYSGTIIR